jgi:hypothetical protein
MCKIYSQAKRVLMWLSLPRELAMLSRPPEPAYKIGEREGSYDIDIKASMK